MYVRVLRPIRKQRPKIDVLDIDIHSGFREFVDGVHHSLHRSAETGDFRHEQRAAPSPPEELHAPQQLRPVLPGSASVLRFSSFFISWKRAETIRQIAQIRGYGCGICSQAGRPEDLPFSMQDKGNERV